MAEYSLDTYYKQKLIELAFNYYYNMLTKQAIQAQLVVGVDYAHQNIYAIKSLH